jgi:uncharacterized surface protein with fasciclin (FAS1) repeats
MFEQLNLVDTISNNAEFSTLGKAIIASGLSDIFKGTGPFTVLAPTNEAFNKLPAETMIDLMKPENKEGLANLLKHHVIDGKIMGDDINRLGTVKTLQGQEIRIDNTNGVKINGVKLKAKNTLATNGVIHVIDAVLLLTNVARVV